MSSNTVDPGTTGTTPAAPSAPWAFRFDNSYARLPERFYSRQTPVPMPAPVLIQMNRSLLNELAVDPVSLEDPEWAEVFTGRRPPAGAEPLAMAYGGHQFGGWAPQLGDGRAVLLGEIITASDGRFDLHLKGAGRTDFSRGGDGRAPLGPVLREYLVSEAVHRLGIPTSRSLAAAATGETVYRERPLPGAVLARVARSHVRVGTFEYFAARADVDALETLAAYVIDRHYPDARRQRSPYLGLLEAVIERQARLVSSWMMVGFIHGVMNTDNTQVAGETIDYGPCAFMDEYHPATVFSSIDRMGRYAYSNQPRVAHWNLACFARALIPLLSDDEEKSIAVARAALDAFPEHYERAWKEGMRKKLGLVSAAPGDAALAESLLETMAEQEADFTSTFRLLAEFRPDSVTGDADVRKLFREPSALDGWLERYRRRLGSEPATDDERRAAMQAVNPLYIPRNHLVEEALSAAIDGDFAPFRRLEEVLRHPYEAQEGAERFSRPPRPDERVLRTFCGT